MELPFNQKHAVRAIPNSKRLSLLGEVLSCFILARHHMPTGGRVIYTGRRTDRHGARSRLQHRICTYQKNAVASSTSWIFASYRARLEVQCQHEFQEDRGNFGQSRNTLQVKQPGSDHIFRKRTFLGIQEKLFLCTTILFYARARVNAISTSTRLYIEPSKFAVFELRLAKFIINQAVKYNAYLCHAI